MPDIPSRGFLLAAAGMLFSLCGHAAQVEVSIAGTTGVRYVSGGAVYQEELAAGRWLARRWAFDSQAPSGSGGLDAFEIRVKTEPSPESVPSTLVSEWRVVSARELEKTARGARHVAVQLLSVQVPLEVTVHTLLDGTPVLKRWLEITNRAGRPIALTSVFPWAGQLWSEGIRNVELGYATRSDCCWEGWFGWKPLKPGANVIRQENGLAYDHPYFVLRNHEHGEYFFGQLEWPVNRIMEFYNANGVSFKIGPTAANALRVIDAGETIATPAVHLAYVKGDFDAAVQAMHDHIRRSVLVPPAPARAYRIECLMPEDQPMTVYRGKEFNESNLKKFLEVASDLGIELYILDGPTWSTNYGDWLKPQPVEFPHGLKPLIAFAHEHNVLFGLYAEPEGGRDGYTSENGGLTIGPWKDNRTFQKHPDWFVQGVVLNLANRDAAAYLEEELTHIVEHYGLDLYRHDFNTPRQGEGSVTERHGFVESDYWRHYEAFYRIFGRLHEKFPSLILQQASAGGTRLDLATVARFPENYTSDRVNMPYVYRMLSGISVYLPPEALVTPIGMSDPGGRPDFDTMLRSIYALGNIPMVFNSLVPKDRDALTPRIRDRFLHYTRIYRDFIRPILPQSKVYHHAPVNATGGVDSGDWFAMEFTSPDRAKGWAVVIRLNKDATASYVLKPRGLDPGRQYAVTIDSSGATETGTGAELARNGLRIEPGGRTYSELLLFTAR